MAVQRSYKDWHKTLSSLNLYIQKEDYPYIEEFCFLNKISHTTILQWADSFPEIRDALDALMAKQKFKLMKMSLLGEVNVISAIFQLKANHGLKETQVNENNNTISVDVINYGDEVKTIKKDDTQIITVDEE